MNTYNPVSRRGLTCWDRQKVPVEELEQRLHAVRSEMKARGIAVLVIHGDTWEYGDLAYVTHYAPKTREALALVPLKGDPVLYIALGSRDVPFAKQITWIRDVFPLPKLVGDLPSHLQGWGIRKGESIGLVNVSEAMRAPLYEDIRPHIEKSPVVNCTDWYRKLRSSKNDREIHLLKEASDMADQCIVKLSEHPIHGRKEYEVAAEIDYWARCLGAEDCRVLLTSGTQSDRFLRPATQRQIGSDEKVMIYLALSAQRYWAERGRTVFASSQENEPAIALREALNLYHGILQVLKSNTDRESWAIGIGQALNAHMEKNRVNTSLSVRGIGLDREELPCIDSLSDLGYLAPNAFVSLRLTQYGPGVGAFFSDPLLVREGGCETVSQTLPKSL